MLWSSGGPFGLSAFRAGRRVGSDVFLLLSRHCDCTKDTHGRTTRRVRLAFRPHFLSVRDGPARALLTESEGTSERGGAIEGRIQREEIIGACFEHNEGRRRVIH